MRSDGNAPLPSEFEVSLFGPGYGECVVIHVGEDNWVVIDSCTDRKSKKPVALEYLDEIGTSANSIKLIVASHWHRDHTYGLSALVNAAKQAEFVCSSAMLSDEFKKFVGAYETASFENGTGVDEIVKTFRCLKEQSKRPTWASPSRRIKTFSFDAPNSNVEVWSLSPSDAQKTQFLTEISAQIPEHGASMRRAPVRNANDLSVVIQVIFEGGSLLMGGDLEQRGDADKGWNAIISDGGRPLDLSGIFKVAHHGAPNGHNPLIWNSMLCDPKIAVLAPFTAGVTPRPAPEDIARIKQQTSQAYLTSDATLPTAIRRPNVVEKQIKRTAKSIKSLHPRMGQIRIRGDLNSPIDAANISLFGGAVKV